VQWQGVCRENWSVAQAAKLVFASHSSRLKRVIHYSTPQISPCEAIRTDLALKQGVSRNPATCKGGMAVGKEALEHLLL
jgi:hypothetical protein